MRRLLHSVLLAGFAAWTTLAPGAAAAEPVIPQFWDARERLAKPELSDLERLRFITTTDFFPFNFIDASGRLSGFHVDLARAICTELGITDRCQIQALPWNEHAQALASGEGEALLSGLAITAENRAKYLFSRPYLSFPARFVARKDADLEVTREALAAKKIGVMAQSAHGRMLRDYFPQAAVQDFNDFDAMLAAVQTGMIDAAFGDGMRISFWLTEKEAADCCAFAGGPFLAPEYLGNGLAIAVAQDRPTLKRALDYALHVIGTNGTFAELYLRYFPVSFF